MNIIKYEGFDNKIFAFAEENDKYFLIYAKTGDPEIIFNNEYNTIHGVHGEKLFQFSSYKESYLQIPFLVNNKSILHFISIENEQQYKLIVSIVRDLL